MSDDLSEYLRAKEPGKAELAGLWRAAIGIKDRVTFSDYYLAPALKLGLVEMTQPNSPRSPTQKYRLTAKGKKLRQISSGSPLANLPYEA